MINLCNKTSHSTVNKSANIKALMG